LEEIFSHCLSFELKEEEKQGWVWGLKPEE
jgi:hypothetical protein